MYMCRSENAFLLVINGLAVVFESLYIYRKRRRRQLYRILSGGSYTITAVMNGIMAAISRRL